MCFYYGKMERAEENGEEDVSQHMKKLVGGVEKQQNTAWD